MDGWNIWPSFSDGLSSGAMLVLGSVTPKLKNQTKSSTQPNRPIRPYTGEPLPDCLAIRRFVSSNLVFWTSLQVVHTSARCVKGAMAESDWWRVQAGFILKDVVWFSGKCGRITQVSPILALLGLDLALKVNMALAYRWSYLVSSLERIQLTFTGMRTNNTEIREDMSLQGWRMKDNDTM